MAVLLRWANRGQMASCLYKTNLEGVGAVLKDLQSEKWLNENLFNR